jgi:hypothetical protein
MGELLKWFGVLILITRFEFGNCRDLWSDMLALSKYIPAPEFGVTTGMARHRFEGMLGGVISQKKEQRESVLKIINSCWLMILSKDSNHIESQMSSPQNKYAWTSQ